MPRAEKRETTVSGVAKGGRGVVTCNRCEGRKNVLPVLRAGKTCNGPESGKLVSAAGGGKTCNVAKGGKTCNRCQGRETRNVAKGAKTYNQC